MSLVSQALADRREQKKTEQRLKAAALANAKASMTFEARLEEDMQIIDRLMEDSNVTRIKAKIADNDLAALTRVLYSGRLAEYSVVLQGNELNIEKEIIDM